VREYKAGATGQSPLPIWAHNICLVSLSIIPTPNPLPAVDYYRILPPEVPMGVAERKEREKQQRIDDILDAAEKIFFQKGLKNATIEDIAAEAQLSKGTIYLYFKCKELIFIGVDYRASLILKDLFQKAVESETIGLEKTLAAGLAYYEFVKKYPHYFAAINYADRLDPEIVQSIANEEIYRACQASEREVLHIIADAISCGIADGSIRPDIDPLKTTIMLWAMGNGVYQMHFNRADDFKSIADLEPDFLVEQYFEFVHRSLAATP
jgi:AcrR family transcriptional regulator